jgi:DNA-binding CsgD family transcriptional regulator
MISARLTEKVPRVRILSEPAEAASELDVLTARELEIARLVAKGFSNKEVGQMLDISHWTVAAHLKATFLKLGLKRRAELVYALRGLI